MTSIPGLSTASIMRVSVTLAKVALVDNTTGAAATDQTPAINVQPVSTTPPDISDAAPMKQFRAIAQIGQDTQALTGTVTAAFKSILAQRPDLANAQFDFVSDDGKLKVVSSDLSDDDRKWLEGQLNANSVLVNQVQQFNADMVSAYDGGPQVVSNGSSLRDTGLQYKNVAGTIDGSVKFLSMIQQVANKAGQTGWFNDATYTDAQGGAIDLAKARTTSLAGMIDTARQLDALISGTIVTHLGNGQTAYGVINPGIFLEAAPTAAAGLASTLVPSTGRSDQPMGTKGQLVDRLV
ncbi:hypothetical protein FHT60_000219 [Novosphingobium sp. BK486]|uniref:hypothetical protein n=2 Tax=unclassified Novosphingobium TaxID=2644732 RepID=UPI00160D926B|nr:MULTISPECIES: hypothetical protein [unclassified Novosphingobium]MBB3373325.1 hypothetical protein [Novosphingobium sp. BK280]MBB3476610.1 hypothetical protein [Novosphingobium sp. BK369]MBB3499377.1 hypothetical protein [Novosphingobium sp. BK336]MBB3535162.1 hypothetical protein [Novosphingobium sp. BK486]MBB3554559.1 hypothetical protein [Novosphingobium sp. BK349]MBB3619159.1 hypothetical protein [Novosphingobium sp. BK592]NOX04238.1 hypothetical protein [Novosphingobium sp. SG754]